MNFEELSALGRKELQSLAKQYNLKANGKTADLIAQILLHIQENIVSSKCEVVEEPQAEILSTNPVISNLLSVADLIVGNSYEFMVDGDIFFAEVVRVNKKTIRLVPANSDEKTVNMKDISSIKLVEENSDNDKVESPAKRKRSENADDERKRPRSNDSQTIKMDQIVMIPEPKLEESKAASITVQGPVRTEQLTSVITAPSVRSPKPRKSDVPDFDLIHQQFFDTQKKITEIPQGAAILKTDNPIKENSKLNTSFHSSSRDGVKKTVSKEKPVSKPATSSHSSSSFNASNNTRIPSVSRPISFLPSTSAVQPKSSSNDVDKQSSLSTQKPQMTFLSHGHLNLKRDSVFMLKEKNERTAIIQTAELKHCLSSPSTPVKMNKSALLRLQRLQQKQK